MWWRGTVDGMTAHCEVLECIERYYDSVPRATARVEDHGAFLLFVATGPWPFYARPRLGSDRRADRDRDLVAVLERQRELGVPQALEWVAEVSPAAEQAALRAGLVVQRHPLLVLDTPLEVQPIPGIELRMAAADDRAIPSACAAIELAFTVGGIEAGNIGVVERDSALARRDRTDDAFVRSLIAVGHMVMVIAESHDGPVAGGTASPRGAVAELTGIATLPASRRRGLGLAVTAVLIAEVRRRGVEVVFLSASDDAVARIYERAGFRRFATACTAHAPPRR